MPDNSKSLDKLEKLLYKPLLFNNGVNETVISIFGIEKSTHKFMGEISETSENVISIFVLDIDKTLEHGHIFHNYLTIKSLDEFLSAIKEAKISKVIHDKLIACSSIAADELDGVIQECRTLDRCSKTLNKIMQDLINRGNNPNVLEILTKSIKDDKIKNLPPKEIKKIISIFGKIISKYLDQDQEVNDELMSKIKNELELSLIKCLPADTKIDKVNINVEYIFNLIKQMKQGKDLSNFNSDDDDIIEEEEDLEGN